ncbi:hypothetical protein [Dactylosporangium cerinum]
MGQEEFVALRPSRLLRTGAVLGLATVLLGLTGVSVVGSTRTRASANAAVAATALAEAYELADDAVALEEIAEQQYRLAAGDAAREAARELHRGAAGALEVALHDVELRGGPADRDLAARVRTLHESYLTAKDRLFDAVDRGTPRPRTASTRPRSTRSRRRSAAWSTAPRRPPRRRRSARCATCTASRASSSPPRPRHSASGSRCWSRSPWSRVATSAGCCGTRPSTSTTPRTTR